MSTPHTLLFRLFGPMQAWGYRSRFEDRDTGLEPTRSGILGLLASACGVEREDTQTLSDWDSSLRLGVRIDAPQKRDSKGLQDSGGFRVESDFHTAQEVYRASGSGKAETVLSTRYYLADARFTVGLESQCLDLLQTLEAGLKNPCWTLSLGRKSFPLSIPPWLPNGGIREETPLFEALKSAPWLALQMREHTPNRIMFALEQNPALPNEIDTDTAIPMQVLDRPLTFQQGMRQFGLRQVFLFSSSKEECGMEVDQCFCHK